MEKKHLILCLLLTAIAVFSSNKASLLPAGFPDRSPKLDILPGFKNPPKGYGEVSFYWWLGDTLTIERITSQLDQLKDKGITGLQINYCHTDKGGASYGLTYPSQPALFGEKWWSLFQWFLKEAKARDMSVSLSDYTLGAAGQGWYIDEMLKENPDLNGTKLMSKQFDSNGNEDFVTKLPANILSIKAYQSENGELASNTCIDLKASVQKDEIRWKSPSGNWKVIVVYKTTVKTSFDPMNPLSGQKVNEMFYQRFEDHCPGESGKGLNFFFSDELQFGIRGFLWNTKFEAEFKKRKGYDITSKVDQLFADLGPESYKTRLDYNDVMVSLTEDGFFKPVYNWHNSRGMLFGCDHGGRGQDVTEFGDYFRTQRWLSGPGCDQPDLGKNIIKTKVASSISHMYERPRTWLEGFYGSGWGTSSAEVADATFSNFAMGHNLLSLHGLYYSTHGSMWEWAAPDNHFRQPYWANMDLFLKCSERLSYILSQGHHRCDVALIYPVAPTEANLKAKESTQTAFDLANDLYPQGIDFDFMDFESLNRCEIKNRELHVSGEQYKVLILPALAAVRYSTIEQALAFYRAGGIVLAVGALPEASDRIGGNDAKLQAMIGEIFGTTFLEKVDTNKSYIKKNKAGGVGMFIPTTQQVKTVIKDLVEVDFKVLAGNVSSDIQHRKLGNRDLYFVYGVEKGTKCFFRAKGKAEIWNPWDGSTKELKVSEVSSTGTTIILPLEKTEPQLIVFSPGKADLTENTATKNMQTITLDNNWEFELNPTLDNKYGDYRLPAFDQKIGVEVWKMKFSSQSPTNDNWLTTSFDDSNWSSASVSYGAQFLKLGPLSPDTNFDLLESNISKFEKADIQTPIDINGKQYYWKPYEFSWRWGLKDDAGHQGYHGLKGIINNEIISFGTMENIRKHVPTYPLSKELGGSVYYLWSTVSSSKQTLVNIRKGGLLPNKIIINNEEIDVKSTTVNLKNGANTILLKYSNIGRGYVVFEADNTNTTLKQSIPLATDWYLNPSILPYNCFPQNFDKFGYYRLMSPPGARSMYIAAMTQPSVWISGVELKTEQVSSQNEKLANIKQLVWKVTIPDSIVKTSQVAVKVKQLPGFYGGAAIPEPITFECGRGIIKLGDLGATESLRTYSGGMWYRKIVNLTAQQAEAKDIILDLGDLASTSEVYLNGALIGQKVTSPWTFELTGKLKVGENKLEIRIFNTLGNHYLTTPSKYVGRTKSGLVGPVTLQLQ